MCSLLRRTEDAARLVMVWAGVAMVSAAKSLAQFYEKLEQSRSWGSTLPELYCRPHHRLHEPLDGPSAAR